MRFPNIEIRPWSNIDSIVLGLCEVVTGLLRVFSLGFYDRDISITYLFWRSKKYTEQKLEDKRVQQKRSREAGQR